MTYRQEGDTARLETRALPEAWLAGGMARAAGPFGAFLLIEHWCHSPPNQRLDGDAGASFCRSSRVCWRSRFCRLSGPA